jgi:hypothetical protein
MNRPRILFLHPPAGVVRYQLDGYCSQPQKGPFRWHPLDFVALASAVHPSADVTVWDLGTHRRTPALHAQSWSAIVGLIGAYGWRHHVKFWREVLAQTRAPVLVSGDIARHDPRRVFDALPGLAGIIPELACPPATEALLGAPSPAIWRPEAARYDLPPVASPFRLGIQPADLWDQRLYRLPFGNAEPFASVLTQVGCPHTCSYCMLSNYRPAFRAMAEVREEARQLARAGVRHLYVRDATLNSSAPHLDAVLDALGPVGLTWNAFARVDGIGADARRLHAAGCRVLMFGLDSVDAATLSRHGKRLRGDIAADISAVRRAGIRTVGHFVLGLDDDQRAEPSEIARFGEALGLDWLTITPLMRRPGTMHWPQAADPGDSAIDVPLPFAAKLSLARFYARPGRWARVTLPTLRKWVGARIVNWTIGPKPMAGHGLTR